MAQFFKQFALVLLVAAHTVHSYAVPFSANTPEFSVAATTDTISVVCTVSVTLSCQAVKIESNSQTTIGSVKVVDSGSDYREVKTIAVESNSIMVCYSTEQDGGKCARIQVDPVFGLMGVPTSFVNFCASGEDCAFLALEKTSNPTKFAICYGLGDDESACTMISVLSSSTASASRVLIMPDTWIASAALTKTSGPLVLCAVTSNEFDVENGVCKLLNDQTLQPIPASNPLNLGPSSTVAAVYAGTLAGNDRLTVCYLSTETAFLYCSAVFLLNNNMFVSSRSAFTATYDSLMGVKLVDLSDDPSSLAVMGCLATADTGAQELICSLIDTDANGVITVDRFEFVVDQNGLYYQDVQLALASDAPVGAYLESSMRSLGSGDTSGDTPVISDASVMPDFMNLFSKKPIMSVESMGCVNVGMSDLDSSRFCVATGAKLSRPVPPPPPFPPNNYCNVKQAWACNARSEYCAMVGVKCISKYACSAQKNAAACKALIAKGGLCQVVGAKCLPSFNWDASTMCQTVTDAKLCKSSPGCVFAAKACRPAPYCRLTTRAACIKSAGCAWVGKGCGAA